MRHQLGLVLSEHLGEFEEAVAVFEDACALRPGERHLRVHLFEALHQAGELPRALAVADALLAEGLLDADTASRVAWNLGTHPDPLRRDAEASLRYARHATERMERDPNAWSTLGVLAFEAGAWSECVNALERSVELLGEGSAFPWYYLAACHAELGEGEAARARFESAARWQREQAPHNAELAALEARARAALTRAGLLP